eukprot:COSAG02_NODE_376_length_23555_cov_31.269185_4_plen_208_part_01
MIALFDAPPILLTVLVLVLGMLGGVSGPNCDNAGEPHADAGAAASDNMEATLIAAGSCLGVEQDVQCGSGDTCCEHTCLEGFTGGSVVCVQGAPTCGTGARCWQVTACEEIVCTQPSSMGYASVAENSLAARSFDVTASCATGYSGTAAALPCSSQGSAYTLTGCVVTTCVPPASAAGYTSISTGSLVKSSFDVSASCADGYEGTADA